MFAKYACAQVNLSALVGGVTLAVSGYVITERPDLYSDITACCFQLRIDMDMSNGWGINKI
jgi:hypothetical protein